MNSSLWKEAFVIMAFCIAMPTVDVYGDLSLAYFHLTYKDCGKKLTYHKVASTNARY